MPYGKGTYGKKVGRPPKKKLYPKELQRMKDASPKTGDTLDKAVQRVEDLKATARAGKKIDTSGANKGIAGTTRYKNVLTNRAKRVPSKFGEANRIIERKKAIARTHKKVKREKARDIVNAKFLPDKPTSPTYNPTIPAWSHKLRAERAARAKRARRSSR